MPGPSLSPNRTCTTTTTCHTQQEIAEAVEVHKNTVSEVCRNLADLPKSDKPAAEHLVARPMVCGLTTHGLQVSGVAVLAEGS